MNYTVSIITINLNNLNGLKKTFQSVLGQSKKAFEYIIIDGYSDDGSKEFIFKNADKLKFWISEPDSGIYNAMNKGIKASSGDYLIFLNSGDYFISQHVLENISTYLGKADHICGRLFWQNDDKSIEEYLYQKVTPNFEYFFNYTIPHQAVFSKRSLFYEYNFFDENLKICADWKFLILTIFKFNSSFLYANVMVSIRSRGGVSTISDNYKLMESERERVLMHYFSNYFQSFLDLKKYRSLESSRFMNFLKKIGFFRYLPLLFFIHLLSLI
jgi:glycosyltransferase involved in cell wall biosynthesis